MADAKISALPAMSALAGTEVLTGVQSSINANATPAQIKAYVAGALGASQIFAGRLLGADMNVTTDQAIAIALPPGYTRWRLNNIFMTNAGGTNLTTAAGGIYSAASKAGTALVANTQVYTALTGAAVNSTGNFLALTTSGSVVSTVFDLATIYFSLTTPQGSAATSNIYINVTPFP